MQLATLDIIFISNARLYAKIVLLSQKWPHSYKPKLCFADKLAISCKLLRFTSPVTGRKKPVRKWNASVKQYDPDAKLGAAKNSGLAGPPALCPVLWKVKSWNTVSAGWIV
jgi:hypothetical protein